jgi:hypothetical protein
MDFTEPNSVDEGPALLSPWFHALIRALEEMVGDGRAAHVMLKDGCRTLDKALEKIFDLGAIIGEMPHGLPCFMSFPKIPMVEQVDSIKESFI